MPGSAPWTAHNRAHAWLLTHAGSAHDRIVADRKRLLLGRLEGDICEIGPGAGVNFGYYPRGSTVVCIEPNPYLVGPAREAARRHGIHARFAIAQGERLPLPAASCDTVVCTLVLCSVQDQTMVLSEILRVLKPGGTFRFVEHVGAGCGSGLRWVQRVIKPLWALAGDGCEPDRDTASALRGSGLELVQMDAFTVGVPIVGPHIAGIARKSVRG
jgi:SAM-dependent methyltransferase